MGAVAIDANFENVNSRFRKRKAAVPVRNGGFFVACNDQRPAIFAAMKTCIVSQESIESATLELCD